MRLCNHDFGGAEESWDLSCDGSQGRDVVCSRLRAIGESILYQCTAEPMNLEWEGERRRKGGREGGERRERGVERGGCRDGGKKEQKEGERKERGVERGEWRKGRREKEDGGNEEENGEGGRRDGKG